MQHELIPATCFFCGKTTKDAVDDGFEPDFCTVGPNGGYGGCHNLQSCKACAGVFLHFPPDGDRYLKTPSAGPFSKSTGPCSCHPPIDLAAVPA